MLLLLTLPADETEGAVDIGALFDAHAGFLHRVVGRMVGTGPQVEDVVQEVFLVAHKRRHDIEDGPAIRGWLYRVAMNLCQHEKRSFARRRRLADRVEQEPARPSERPDDDSARREHGQRVREIVLALPEKQREVMVLFELEGIEGSEIAGLLDVPVNTVWTRLHHARRRFRELWSEREAAEQGRRGAA